MITTRIATPQDVDTWRALRRDGIARYPQAFVATLAEADAIPVDVDARNLDHGTRLLAFDGGTPVGLAGINPNGISRAAHRAEVGPFYVIPQAQGGPAAAALMQGLLDLAQARGLWQLELYVNRDNARAIAFYRRAGFERFGEVPNALQRADGFESDLFMIRTGAR